MRVKLLGLGVLLAGGALGCFEAVSEFNEAEAVAEALTRGMHFDGGEVRDGDLPGGASSVFLLAPSAPTVMSPGQVSLMSFDLEDASEPEDPSEATLLQFEGSRKHIRVTGGGTGKGEGARWHYEHHFTVDSNICDGLCNKQHVVKLRMAMKMRTGETSAEEEMNLTLDCSERGDSNYCDSDSRGNVAVPGTDFLQACQKSAGVCSGLSDDIGISSDVVECVALYQCVQVIYTGDSYCQGLVQDLVGCMAKADDEFECNDCGSISDELMNNCPFPQTCLGLSNGFDASVGPAPTPDASRPLPGGDLPLTGSLIENCSMLCDLAQEQACPNFSDTCVEQCEGGLTGTACEQALVEVQRCAWDMSGQTFNCDDTGSPVFSSGGAAMCPGETMKFSECVLNSPEFFPDGGVPPVGVDAGQQGNPDAGFGF